MSTILNNINKKDNMLHKWCEVSPFLISIVVLFQMKVTEYVLDENDQLMPMNRLHGENTVSDIYHQHTGKNACGLYSVFYYRQH